MYVIPEHKLLQIADESMQEIVPNEAGRYALGTNDKQYRPMLDYGDRYQDYFLVDLEDGHRTPLVKKSESTLRWSVDGRYATTFDGKDWIAIALPSGRNVNLTSKLPVKFWNEETTPRPLRRPMASPDGPKMTSICCSMIASTFGRSPRTAARR